MEQPLFKHSGCDGCEYLGRFHDGSRWNDLYRCSDVLGTKLLARWGDGINEDVCLPQETLHLAPEMGRIWPGLVEADRRARVQKGGEATATTSMEAMQHETVLRS